MVLGTKVACAVFVDLHGGNGLAITPSLDWSFYNMGVAIPIPTA